MERKEQARRSIDIKSNAGKITKHLLVTGFRNGVSTMSSARPCQIQCSVLIYMSAKKRLDDAATTLLLESSKAKLGDSSPFDIRPG